MSATVDVIARARQTRPTSTSRVPTVRIRSRLPVRNSSRCHAAGAVSSPVAATASATADRCSAFSNPLASWNRSVNTTESRNPKRICTPAWATRSSCSSSPTLRVSCSLRVSPVCSATEKRYVDSVTATRWEAKVAFRSGVRTFGGRQQALPENADRLPEFGTPHDPEGRRAPGELLGVPGGIAGAAGQAGRLVAEALELPDGAGQAPADQVEGRVDDDLDVVLPADGEVFLDRRDRVEVAGWFERAVQDADTADPVDPVRPPLALRVLAAQQVPAAVPDHDGPRLDVAGPLGAGLGAVAEAD